MDGDERVEREEVIAAVRQLRWLVCGLKLGGFDSFHVRRRGGGGAPSGKAPGEHASGRTLSAIREELGACERCRLHSTRAHLVFGEGSESARLVFVGEGPGFDEDRQGRPFVGRAGKLLDKMIKALGLQREDVYICNVVKCRPPNNRTPNSDEIESCFPFLAKQLEALHPVVICALGACAAQTLLGAGSAISKLRGKPHMWRGIPVVATFHPAYLLRNPGQKAGVWQDLLQVRKMLHEQ